jgi:hypothetical protein
MGDDETLSGTGRPAERQAAQGVPDVARPSDFFDPSNPLHDELAREEEAREREADPWYVPDRPPSSDDDSEPDLPGALEHIGRGIIDTLRSLGGELDGVPRPTVPRPLVSDAGPSEADVACTTSPPVPPAEMTAEADAAPDDTWGASGYDAAIPAAEPDDFDVAVLDDEAGFEYGAGGAPGTDGFDEPWSVG